MTKDIKPARIAIIGGSLAGLFTGSLLAQQGHEVHIFERATGDLDSRGGGIVLQNDVLRVYDRLGVLKRAREHGVPSQDRVVLDPTGHVAHRGPAPQIQTSWPLIFRTVRDALGSASYHSGKTLERIGQDTKEQTATAHFTDGTSFEADLIIGADGHGSKVRSLLWPEAEPTYAGYIAWRGLVHETALPESTKAQLSGNFGFASAEASHMLGYLVPGDGGDLREGHRDYNWVWYRTIAEDTLPDVMTDRDGRHRGYSVPEGRLSDDWAAHVYADALAILPPSFSDAVLATEKPFAQAIRDLTVNTMVKGRVILLGDAAFVPRPHTAASTSKAASNALDLADAMAFTKGDIDQALLRWEPDQLTLGRRLYKHGTSLGNQIMFRKPIAA